MTRGSQGQPCALFKDADSDEMVLFDTEDEAEIAAELTGLGRVNGFEVYEWD